MVRQLIEEGFEKVDEVTPDGNSWNQIENGIDFILTDSGKKIFCVDTIVPDLITFPPNVNVRKHPLFAAGAFLFQVTAFWYLAIDT